MAIVPMAGAPRSPMLCRSISSNGDAVDSLRLKPVVVAFARLLATTSMLVCWAIMPVAAE